MQDLAHALRSKLAGHGRFGAPRREPDSFVVRHYAGEVVYCTDHLLGKNRVRQLRCDVLGCAGDRITWPD